MDKATKKITIFCSDEENELEDIINSVKTIGNTGHGFEISMDKDLKPENDEAKIKTDFYWDGDGGDKIFKIDVEDILEELENLKESITTPIFLFHSTPSKNSKNIKEKGLLLGFDNRIYLSSSIGAAMDIAQQLANAYKENDVNFYSIFKVNTKNLKLNIDDDYNAGFFVTNPIPPKDIRIYDSIKIEKNLEEDITLDIDKGDTIKTGKFRNKKVVVKDIDTDEHGLPTVNGKAILKIRIPKNDPTEKLKESLTDKIIKESKKYFK